MFVIPAQAGIHAIYTKRSFDFARDKRTLTAIFSTFSCFFLVYVYYIKKCLIHHRTKHFLESPGRHCELGAAISTHYASIECSERKRRSEQLTRSLIVTILRRYLKGRTPQSSFMRKTYYNLLSDYNLI